MVDAGREKQPILGLKPLLVIAISPRLAMASPEMNWVIDVRDSATALNLHHTLLKEPLAATRNNKGLTLGGWDGCVTINLGLNVVFPHF
jgi:hypothetical protein